MLKTILLLLYFLYSVLTAELKTGHHYEKHYALDTSRLPNTTYPLSNYLELDIRINQNISEYNGHIRINLVVVEATDKITIHSSELNINGVSLFKDNNIEIEGVSHNVDDENEFLTIFTEPEHTKMVPGDQYSLFIKFSGKYRDDGTGLYKSSYNDSNTQLRWVLSTQFETQYARKTFPCYDEPSFKSHYTIVINHDANYNAISNMPIESEVEDLQKGTVQTKFEKTPPMSAYNLAFVISQHKNVSQVVDGVLHQVFLPLVDGVSGDFALAYSIRSIKSMEQMLGLKYPLKKIDHISVPSHIASAMENWGLIIYNFGRLLPTYRSSDFENLNVIAVISHEIAHQWFGNLVTAKWWNNVWLNEGLSTYYAAKLMDSENKLKYWEYSLIKAMGGVVWTSTESKPLTHYSESGKDMNYNFNFFSYYKVAYILHMFSTAMGEDTFNKGVRNYLKKYSFDIVDEKDFFDSLQSAASKDHVRFFKEWGTVEKYMSSWMNQESHPVIIATRNYEDDTFTLFQQTYDEDMNMTKPDAKEKFWYIPVSFITASDINIDKITVDLIFPNQRSIEVNPRSLNRSLKGNDWLILNTQLYGLYRVNYDERNWEIIINALVTDYTVIPTYNRAQLIRDAGSFVIRKMLPFQTTFRLLSYLKNETEIVPWFEALKVLLDMYLKIEKEYYKEYFKYFFRDIAKNIHSKIENVPLYNRGPFTESFLTTHFRQALLEFLYLADSQESKTFVEEQLQKLIDEKYVDPLLKETVFCLTLISGQLEFGEVMQLVEKNHVTINPNDYFTLFFCQKNEPLKHLYLKINSIML